MNDRDRLIKDLRISKTEWLEKECDHETDKELVEYVADYLIANGVIVRKRAKWIYATDCYLCSICAGKRFDLLLGTDAEYCPYCGAKMIFGETEEQAKQKLKEMRGE